MGVNKGGARFPQLVTEVSAGELFVEMRMAGGGRCWRLEVPDNTHLTSKCQVQCWESLGEWHAHGIAFETAGVQSHQTAVGWTQKAGGLRTAPGHLISEVGRLGRR